jgi:hypothetical protein
MGDIGRPLGITAVAAGNLLEQLGYRFERHVTDSAVATGCGVRRWDGYAFHDDWHLDRAVAAIKSAAQLHPEVADALAAAITKQEARQRVAARKRKHEEMEAAHRKEEDALVSRLRAEVIALRASDPTMGLHTAVEYVTPHPAHRLALYRACHEDQSTGTANDLALLERRAQAEGFQGFRRMDEP